MDSYRHGRPRVKLAPEDSTNFIGTLLEMAYTMKEQAATVHHMMDQLGRQPEGG